MKGKLKQNYGITLIALIVTIIVLIILAAISIGVITSEDGIIEKTKFSAFATKVRQYEENVDRYLIDEEQNGNNSNDIYITDPEKIKEILGENIEDGDENKYAVQDGEIRYNPDEVTNKEEEWLIELGIAAIQPVVPGPPIETGNYLVAGKYYDTLQEAIDAAEIGSEITVISNTSEIGQIVIDKDITINTNNKTLAFLENGRITINEGMEVSIDGNGTITTEDSRGAILNYGNLITNNVTINSPISGHLYSTITSLSPGNVTSNNSNIDAITCEGGIVTINGGQYENLSGYPNNAGTYIINDGNIEYISLIKGGTCKINKGEIGAIDLSSDAGDIDLTIGDIDEQVNDNNPKIGDIKIISGDLAGIECVINFYNGIIEKCQFDIYGGESVGGMIYNIRSGYKIQKNSNGFILIKE